MKQYGEILFLGLCNLKCFYCLSAEMKKLKKEKENQMNVHFKEWKDFDTFLLRCKDKKIDTIYLSSVTTEPMLYKYINMLIKYLREKGFHVGIRTNGYYAEEKIEALLLCNEEISFSINSFNEKTNNSICKCNYIPNWSNIFEMFRKDNKKCRISIVVNQYNYNEILDMLDFLSKYKDIISYVQLRRVYKYDKQSKNIDGDYYYKIIKDLENIAKEKESFYESRQFLYKDLSVSLWNDVFKKESITSINYFTNGIISTNNLLIPAYEKGETE